MSSAATTSRPGDTIVLGTYMVHHDPRYWDHPDRFDPDRFAAERAKGRAPYSYLPFGGGKRACIGSAMSQIEAALALSLFLRDFEFEYARDEAPRISLTVTLSPKQGLPLRISGAGRYEIFICCIGWRQFRQTPARIGRTRLCHGCESREHSPSGRHCSFRDGDHDDDRRRVRDDGARRRSGRSDFPGLGRGQSPFHRAR